MSRHATKSLRDPLGVAVIAPRSDFRAAGYRIPSCISPLDARILRHSVYCNSIQWVGQGYLKASPCAMRPPESYARQRQLVEIAILSIVSIGVRNAEANIGFLLKPTEVLQV